MKIATLYLVDINIGKTWPVFQDHPYLVHTNSHQLTFKSFKEIAYQAFRGPITKTKLNKVNQFLAKNREILISTKNVYTQMGKFLASH